MIYVLAKFTIRPEHRAEYLAAARSVVAETVKEPDCVYYDVAGSITDPNCYTFIEHWPTREALSKHFETAHLKKWAKDLVPYTIKIETEVIHPENVEVL